MSDVDPDLLFAGYLALPWLLPLLVLVLTLVGGVALGAVIVAVIGAIRAGLRGGDRDSASGADSVDLAELFGDVRQP